MNVAEHHTEYCRSGDPITSLFGDFSSGVGESGGIKSTLGGVVLVQRGSNKA